MKTVKGMCQSVYIFNKVKLSFDSVDTVLLCQCHALKQDCKNKPKKLTEVQLYHLDKKKEEIFNALTWSVKVTQCAYLNTCDSVCDIVEYQNTF